MEGIFLAKVLLLCRLSGIFLVVWNIKETYLCHGKAMIRFFKPCLLLISADIRAKDDALS